jgi:hypothetical protein
VKLGLTLREEHSLTMFEKSVLREKFRPKKEKEIGGLRKLNNEELCNLYSSPIIIRINQIKEDEMVKACGMNRKGD